MQNDWVTPGAIFGAAAARMTLFDASAVEEAKRQCFSDANHSLEERASGCGLAMSIRPQGQDPSKDVAVMVIRGQDAISAVVRSVEGDATLNPMIAGRAIVKPGGIQASNRTHYDDLFDEIDRKRKERGDGKQG